MRAARAALLRLQGLRNNQAQQPKQAQQRRACGAHQQPNLYAYLSPLPGYELP